MPTACAAAEAVLIEPHWLTREVRLFWARTLKRLDVSSRTLVALVEPGSCFAGMLAELVLAADRSLALDGAWERTADPPATTPADGGQRRLVPDGQRPVATRDPLLGTTGGARSARAR